MNLFRKRIPSGIVWVMGLFALPVLLPFIYFRVYGKWEHWMVSLSILSFVVIIGLPTFNLYAYLAAVLALTFGMCSLVYFFVVPLVLYSHPLFGVETITMVLMTAPCLLALWYLLRRRTREWYLKSKI